MKPRNKPNPVMNKGHAHKSDKDYDRKRDKKELKQEINNYSRGLENGEATNKAAEKVR